jgi:hypothetical protein
MKARGRFSTFTTSGACRDAIAAAKKSGLIYVAGSGDQSVVNGRRGIKARINESAVTVELAAPIFLISAIRKSPNTNGIATLTWNHEVI